MARVRVGPAHIPSRESPAEAVALLLERGYDACEVDFEGGFWLDREWAAALGEEAAAADVSLSVHAPLAAFPGHTDRAKWKRALGMLDHTAGLAVAAQAEVVVVHPGFLLGRDREASLDAVVADLDELRERLLGKGRNVAFGVEVMGRVRELGTVEDILAIADRAGWVRPVLDFAHMHATSDGAFLEAAAFASVLERADAIQEAGTPFHVHFSDIAWANRNEKNHLPYGEGTLRAEPLREALARFERPATIVSESPDEASHQAIRAVLAQA